MQREGGWSGSRRLLKRVRDVMASPCSAQERLDQVVKTIATDMVAEVCSIYLMRAGEVLELFATEGLKSEAVHRTRLRVGEGLVGDIAAHMRPLAVADAHTHPSFAYRPETGEEAYNSLMGVPVLRGGRNLGVIVVQNRTLRNYTEEEVETLETVATVLAELVASGELVNRSELLPADGIALLPLRLEGMRLNAGLAMGVAVLHQPQITIRQLVAENPDAELDRLREAMAGMHNALVDLIATWDLGPAGQHQEILETYRMIAEDRGWLGRISEAIKSGLTAEAAVQKVHNDIRARMSQISDHYMRERLLDFEDLANRLLQHLTGAPTPATGNLPDDMVLVARSIGPAELLEYDRRQLRGLVLEEGSPTSHAAIIARALEIPVVGRVSNFLSVVEPQDPVIVDGDHGLVFVRAGDDIEQSYRESLRARAGQKAAYAKLRRQPAVSVDCVPVSLNLNAGLLIDIKHVHDTGADGIGLYRTEMLFMVRSVYPDIATQTQLYRRVLELALGKPVVFRTLDVGGDKKLPYAPTVDEDNPAMGWRAMRMALDRPAFLRQQLRALIRAAAGEQLNLMFPMVAEVAELDFARRILELELDHERGLGHPLPERIRVGVTLEVPSLLWQLPRVLERIDFLSVGSNDLMQFLFASDRGNPRLSERYDPLSPPVLTILRQLVKTCDEAGVPLAICGEIAGRPLEAMTLIGLGFRSLSMSPQAIGPVKTMVRSLEVTPLRRYLSYLCDLTDHSVREKLRGFARDHGVAI